MYVVCMQSVRATSGVDQTSSTSSSTDRFNDVYYDDVSDWAAELHHEWRRPLVCSETMITARRITGLFKEAAFAQTSRKKAPTTFSQI